MAPRVPLNELFTTLWVDRPVGSLRPLRDNPPHKQQNPGLTSGALFWLRERRQDSKILWAKLPIFLHNTQHGAKILVIDPARIHNYIDMAPDAVKKLTESFIYPAEKDKRTKRHRQDIQALKNLYLELLDTGKFKNRAALAAHFGVSRAWISKVLNQPIQNSL